MSKAETAKTAAGRDHLQGPAPAPAAASDVQHRRRLSANKQSISLRYSWGRDPRLPLPPPLPISPPSASGMHGGELRCLGHCSIAATVSAHSVRAGRFSQSSRPPVSDDTTTLKAPGTLGQNVVGLGTGTNLSQQAKAPIAIPMLAVHQDITSY
jgi:hypothetical protein